MAKNSDIAKLKIKIYDSLRSLPENVNKSEEEIWQLTEESLKTEDLKNSIIDGLFTDNKEKNQAKELLNRYLNDFVIENVSDHNILRQLVLLEISCARLQDDITRMRDMEKTTPIKLLEGLHDNLSKITELKETLKIIDKSKKKENLLDDYTAFQKLMFKFKKWREENQGSRTLTCPYCQKQVLLKIRMDKWEALKHPYFKDRLLYNEHLFKMYDEGKITIEDVSKVLQVSVDYVLWMKQKVNTPASTTGEK